MVYNYTIPRGPIGAMYGSPGPIYQLPNLTGYTGHDARSTHSRGPARQFGLRVEQKPRHDTPPPNAYYPRGAERTGKPYSPKFSVYSRVKDIMPFNNPGPGTFDPKELDQSLHYSIGRRLHHKIDAQGPSPDTYSLPSLLGKTYLSSMREGPQHSLHGKLLHGSYLCDYQRTPAPGTYEATNPSKYKTRLPEYSIFPRTPPLAEKARGPPPGAHYPELVKLHKPIPPKYSFGIRHSQYSAPLIVATDN